jgi:Flp pilus assembly protein TadD
VDAAQRLNLLRVALAAVENGRAEQAEQACRPLVAHDPDDIEALLLLGLAVGMRGKAEAAAPLLNRVASRRSDHAHPCRDLARLLGRLSRTSLIEPQFRACLCGMPCDLRLNFAFAEFLRERGRAMEAVTLLEPLLHIHPTDAEVHYQLGLAFADAGRFAVAAERFRQAIDCDPDPAVFWANLGMMLKVEGRFDESLTAYAEALSRDPTNHQIRVNRAVARLHAGRFAEAWQDEDWVLAEPGRSALPAETRLPPLSRVPDLEGRTVLVVQEEGLGDTLQFLRYLPLLAGRGARVIAIVPPALVRLMRAIPGVAEVPGGEAPVPRFDYHCSFNGLPRAFETTLESIPCDVPYIAADVSLIRQWAARLAPTDGLRVGLVWAGQARPWLPGFVGLDARRSMHLATLTPLAEVPGIQLVNLQKGNASTEIRSVSFDLLDVMGEVRDFADTAAIVANLDLVISVDTSVVHLAGAMGKPVFMLDRYDNCWRWLSGREDSPWYPTLRIFRQQQPGEWGPVIARIAAAVRSEQRGRQSATTIVPSECAPRAVSRSG